MCLGLPARVVDLDCGHADLASVDMAGTLRMINIGLLADEAPLVAGDWVLVHMGFALQTMTEAEARDAIEALGEERRAVALLLDGENSG
jgi:hydrogenase maturation protein HypF